MSSSPESAPTPSSPEAEASEWDSLRESVRKFQDEQIEKAPERAAFFYKDVLDIQNDFSRRTVIVQESGKEMERKEFEKWEDAVTDDLGYAKREISRRHMNLDAIAEVSQHMIFSANDAELHKTIEAQAGRFYYERMDALRKAIQETGGENAEKDLDYARNFFPAVMTHLDFKYMTPADVRDYGYDDYERQRTRAHNDAIKHLNGLNDLAKKYHTRPFTVRNFWSSDIREKRGQTPAIQRVMRYDRDIVEEYYAIAFSEEVRKRQNKQNRQIMFGY